MATVGPGARVASKTTDPEAPVLELASDAVMVVVSAVSFFALMLMNGIVNLATTIPSAPGYIGTFDAPGIAVLVAYGVDQATAAGYTLVLHVALWLPITLLGAYYMTREGVAWNDSLRTETE